MNTFKEEARNEDEVVNDLLTFKLPSDKLPGTDLLSKSILKTTTVIDLITSSLLDVPEGTYTNAGTEWNNGSRSDAVYVPSLAIQNSLPPIMIEVQSVVNEAFMERLVKYCQIVKHLYKLYPLVLVFCIDKLSPSTLITKFQPVNDNPWMQQIVCCDFWAKRCYLVSRTSLSSDESDTNISSLKALSMFFIEQSPTLHGHSHSEHPTIRTLYRLSMECIEHETGQREDLERVVEVICSNNETLWRKVDASLANIPNTLKAKAIVTRALEFNNMAKRKYIEVEDSDSSLEPLPSRSIKKPTAKVPSRHDDLEFIANFRKNLVGKMSWARCLELAHEKNLCKRFSTSESLRSFYRSSHQE